jgi:hypothetical protein
MIKITIVCIALAAVSADSVSKDSNGFYQLNDKNFADFIDQNPGSLVFFTNNGCSGCDNLKQILSDIAPQFAASHPNLKIATLHDESSNKYATRDLKIVYFPQLRIYTNKDLYSSHIDIIDKTHILQFLGNHVGHVPSITEIEPNLSKFESERIALYISGPNMDDLREFAMNVQKTFPEIPVYIGPTHTDFNNMVFKQVTLDYKLMLKRDFDEGNKYMNGEKMFNYEGLTNFVHFFRYPKVMNINAKNSEKIFRYRLPVIVVFDDDYNNQSMKEFTESVQDLYFQGLFLKSKLTEPNSAIIADLLGVTQEDFPTLRILQFGSNRLQRFKYEGKWTKTAIREFIDSYIDKKEPEYFRSEQPEDNTGKALHKIAKSNFDSLVQNTQNDTVVIFTSEKSPNEKKVNLAYEEAANKLKGVKNFVIGRVNLDKNDFVHLNLAHLPLIQIFKKGTSVMDPVKYNGEITAEGFVKFISEKLQRNLDAELSNGEL